MRSFCVRDVKFFPPGSSRRSATAPARVRYFRMHDQLLAVERHRDASPNVAVGRDVLQAVAQSGETVKLLKQTDASIIRQRCAGRQRLWYGRWRGTVAPRSSGSPVITYS